MVPTTEVSLQSTDSRCAPDIAVEAASYVLQLGVYCGIFDGYTHSDIFIECEEGGSFASLDEMGGLGSRYSCGSIAIFIGGTTPSELNTPTFSASTDNLWLTDAHSSCYRLGGSSSVSDPTAAPATAVTGAPVVSTGGPEPMSPSITPPMPSPAPNGAPNSAPTEAPSVALTETPTEAVVVANYKAEYTAEFQHTLAGSCEGPPPDLHVLCTGNVRLVSTSRPSISCAQLPPSSAIESHPNGLLCTIDCESAGDCDAYTNDFINIFRFENVVFECSGDRLDDISGTMQILQSSEAHTCPNSDEEPSQIHVGRLGVSCGTEQQREVTYDHTMFECIIGSGFAFSLENGFGNPSNNLDCAQIDNCSLNEDCDCTNSGTECPLAIGIVGITSDVYNFPEQCVQGTATFTNPPSPSPIDSSESGVLLTTKFRTNWSLFTDSAVVATRCNVNSVVGVIQCMNSDINLLEAASSVTCNKESDSTLRCSDSRSSFEGDFASFVEYVSRSDN